MKTILVSLCLISGLSLPVYGAVVCPHNTFSCLEQHMNDFYLADHDRFYAVYKQAFMRAMQCHNHKDVARYLTIYSSEGDNAEIDESMQQDTEALILLKPVCFFEAVMLLTPEQRDNLVGKYRLFSRPKHVMALLHRYMKSGKYRKVATLIYNANLEAYQN